MVRVVKKKFRIESYHQEVSNCTNKSRPYHHENKKEGALEKYCEWASLLFEGLQEAEIGEGENSKWRCIRHQEFTFLLFQKECKHKSE